MITIDICNHSLLKMSTSSTTENLHTAVERYLIESRSDISTILSVDDIALLQRSILSIIDANGQDFVPRRREYVSQIRIDELGTGSYQDLNTSNQDTCSICICDMNDGDTYRKLPCGHLFHKDCIDSYLLENSTKCPNCRHDVIST